MSRTLHALALATLLSGPSVATANEFEGALMKFLDSDVRPWASDPSLVTAIRAQNDRTSALSQADIDAMDQTWQAEIGADARPTIEAVLQNATADLLRAHVEASGGAVTEIFIMDGRGLNVAASAVTSDYWQGDEAKFQETFPNGAGAFHIGEVEFDESSQSYQSQISVAIVDPATSEVVGAMTVGVNAEALF